MCAKCTLIVYDFHVYHFFFECSVDYGILTSMTSMCICRDSIDCKRVLVFFSLPSLFSQPSHRVQRRFVLFLNAANFQSSIYRCRCKSNSNRLQNPVTWHFKNQRLRIPKKRITHRTEFYYSIEEEERENGLICLSNPFGGLLLT